LWGISNRGAEKTGASKSKPSERSTSVPQPPPRKGEGKKDKRTKAANNDNLIKRNGKRVDSFDIGWERLL